MRMMKYTVAIKKGVDGMDLLTWRDDYDLQWRICTVSPAISLVLGIDSSSALPLS